jgi:hypothetical protein
LNLLKLGDNWPTAIAEYENHATSEKSHSRCLVLPFESDCIVEGREAPESRKQTHSNLKGCEDVEPNRNRNVEPIRSIEALRVAWNLGSNRQFDRLDARAGDSQPPVSGHRLDAPSVLAGTAK